jgi:hypothetical protein
MNKYDYYGNYNNDIKDITFSVYDIHKEQKEKEDKNIKIYNIILKKLFQKIKLTVKTTYNNYCFFQLPEYLQGYPLYNMTKCLWYITNILHAKGFHSKYCNDHIIFIKWKEREEDLKLQNLSNVGLLKSEPEKNQNYRQTNQQQTSNQYKLQSSLQKKNKFRSINDYKPKGDFLYNSNINKHKQLPKQQKKEIFLDF